MHLKAPFLSNPLHHIPGRENGACRGLQDLRHVKEQPQQAHGIDKMPDAWLS
jgi:hypothetical protein